MSFSSQEAPDLPSYLHEGKVGRVPHGEVSLSRKRILGCFRRGFQDGRFNGWRGSWELPSVPASVGYHSEMSAQVYLLHTYTVGFFMGSTESCPDPRTPDPSAAAYHASIAEVSRVLSL